MPVRRRSKIGVIAGVVAGVVVVAIAASAAYGYVVAPPMALGGYLKTLVGAKTVAFALSDTTSGDGYHVTLKANGKGDITAPSKPKVALTASAQITSGSAGESASGSVSGQLKVVDQTLYFQLGTISYLTQLLPIKISDSWYKYELGDTDTGKCLSKGKESGSFLGSQVLTDIPVKNTHFAGLDTIAGGKAWHFSGTVDNAKIKAAIDKANKQLSADCKIDATDDDFKNVVITYDLWRGFGKDRLKIDADDTKDKTKSELILDTSDYNKPANITAPAGAQDVKTLIQQLFGSLGSDVTAGDSFGSTGDTQRKNDLSRLAAAAEAYAADHSGSYPANAAAMSQAAVEQTFSGSDPTTKKPYAFVATKPASVGQVQYVLGKTCNLATNLATDTGTSRNFALVTLYEDGKTYYCIDNS
jgi:hypothetical protein